MFAKGPGALRRWCMSKGSITVLVVGCIFTALFFAANTAVMWYTGTEAFCTGTCHEMRHVTAEHKGTIHDVNRSGVRAACPDCHVPKSLVPLYLRKVGTVSDLWGHFVTGSIDSKEKFEAKRYELAKRVWIYMKETDSRECRYCHDDAKMDPEKLSEKAKVRHEKGKREGMTCIDCHFAIAHTEPEGGPGPQELKVEKKP